MLGGGVVIIHSIADSVTYRTYAATTYNYMVITLISVGSTGSSLITISESDAPSSLILG